MIITVTIQGGATITFSGVMAYDIFSVMEGYCSTEELNNPDASIMFRDSETVKSSPEAVEVQV